MIDFSSFSGSWFPLAPTGGGVVVVEGPDLDRRVNGWPNGNIGLLRMGAHGYSTIVGANLCEGVETVCSWCRRSRSWGRRRVAALGDHKLQERMTMRD